ncbi:DUF4194 domain-containing protein [Oligella urethralis]|uniref:DUF4194 domain-containing protein n=1 Tax=Oligella urethralis TaxID=90245 RepID=A0A2X1UTI6_9BURK|nr:DUF4194 domain-containing protein [Oligella urethralis]SPY07751.1 Uncharacterised protein [Oligella urethralis]
MSEEIEDTEQTQGTEPVQNLPAELRRALVYLLKNSIVLHADNPQLFSSLCHYQQQIRDYLRQIYIYLVLDEIEGVAFIAREPTEQDLISEEENDVPSLIAPRSLSVLDTLLLLILRKHYQERQTAGEQKVMIDIERIEAQLTPFTALVQHASKDRRRLVSSLKNFVERKLLLSVSSGERYEITPIIRYVVNAQFLETMLAEYRQLAQVDAGVADE